MKPVAITATADLVTAENDQLRIEFARKDGLIRLAKLVNKSDNRTVLENVAPLWSIQGGVGVVSGADPTPASTELAAKQLPGGGARLALLWKGVKEDALDVEVTVDVLPGSPETQWRIHPVSQTGTPENPKNLMIQTVQFPVLDGIGAGGKWDRLIRPHNLKTRALNPETLKASTILYPSGGRPDLSYEMQFVIYEFAASGCTNRQEYEDQNQVGGGLYVAAYDPLCQMKEFSCKGLGEGKGTSLAIGHFGEGLVTEQDGKPGLGFPCVVGVFDGGYWRGLDLYRDWARAQPWCSVGPIRKRTDFSWKFLNTHTWYPPGFDPSQEVMKKRPVPVDGSLVKFEDMSEEEKASLVPTALSFAEDMANGKGARDKWIGTATFPPGYGLHWYRWHIYLFDYAYPDYFPLRPGWMEAREQIDKAHPGFFTHMPYINGRAVCEHSERWQKNKEEVLKDSTGRAENYGGVHFEVMCPETDYWQETMVSLAKRIFTETKVDGLYLDQLGAPPVRCLKSDHGHLAGDPASTTHGYQTMLRKIRAAVKPINPDAFFTQEFFSEPHVGLIDGFLTWMSMDVSLIAYVYGEYGITFGHCLAGQEMAQNLEKEGRSYLSGSALGWVLGSSNPLVMEYRKKLSRFRAKSLPYLLQPMVRPLVSSASLRVLATSLRRGDQGEALVIATNPQLPEGVVYNPTTPKPETLKETYQLDCKADGFSTGKYRLKVITQTEEKDLGTVEGPVVKFEMELPPQESAVYVLTPVTGGRGK